MNKIRLVGSETAISSDVPISKGSWEFVCEKVKDFVQAVGIIIFCSTIILPVCYHTYKTYKKYHSFTPSGAVMIEGRKTYSMIEELTKVLNEHLNYANEKAEIFPYLRKDAETILGLRVISILKENNIFFFEKGIGHDIFQKLLIEESRRLS